MAVFRRRKAGPLPATGEGFAQVGRGAVVRGELQGSGILVVHGELAGRVDVQGDVLVAPGGRLARTRLRAAALRVEGQADGRIRVDGTVEVAAGGTLTGDIEARGIQTSPGSTFAGTLRVSS